MMADASAQQHVVFITGEQEHKWTSLRLVVVGIIYIVQQFVVLGMITHNTANVYYLEQESPEKLPTVHTSTVRFAPPWILFVAFEIAGVCNLLWAGPLNMWIMEKCVLRGKHTYRWLECSVVSTLVWLAAAYEAGVRTEEALVFIAVIVCLVWYSVSAIEYFIYNETTTFSRHIRVGVLLPFIAAWIIIVALVGVKLHWAFASYGAGLVSVLSVGDAMMWCTILMQMVESTNVVEIAGGRYTSYLMLVMSSTLLVQRSIIFWVIIGKLFL